MDNSRRGLLGLVLAAAAAPAIVRAESLMKLSCPPIWMPPGITNLAIMYGHDDNVILYPENALLRHNGSSLYPQHWSREQRQYVERYCAARNSFGQIQERRAFHEESKLRRARENEELRLKRERERTSI